MANQTREDPNASAFKAFKCADCGQDIPLEGLTTLSYTHCPHCDREQFVPRRINGYYLYGQLAVGGMGCVYLAFHPDVQERRYAVKLLPPGKEEDPLLAGGLLDEIQVMTVLGEHPCLIKSVMMGIFDDMPYMISELVDGESMKERVDRAGKLPELETLLISLRVLSAESYIYNKGYLYRDIKPENIIIHDEVGAYLCDFGICMTLEDALNDTGDLVQGSPLYFPPERLLGEGEQASSEIYSLGLVLYYALTGRPYFNATEIEAVAHLHVWAADAEDQERKLREIKPDLAEVIEKMIRRNPEDRYQSFMEVERDLFQILCNRMYTRGY